MHHFLLWSPRCRSVISLLRWHIRALCPRHPASTKPTRRCSSIESRTFPGVNNTTSGQQPWQLQAKATSARRSPWSPQGKVGHPSGRGIKQFKWKVTRQIALGKISPEITCTAVFPLAPSTPPAIDWQLWYWSSRSFVARNAVVNYVVMNRAYPVKWPLGREVEGTNQ